MNKITLARDLLADPPVIGEVWRQAGFDYECLTYKPHTTKTGEPSAIAGWRGQCADCGRFFDFSTGAKIRGMARRCEDHRAGKAWRRAVPWAGPDPRAGALHGEPVTDVASLATALFKLRRVLLTQADPLGSAAVGLAWQLLNCWVFDPVDLRPENDEEAAALHRATLDLIRAAGAYEAPALAAEDLI